MNRFLQVFCVFFSSLIFSLSIPNRFLTFGSVILGMTALIPQYIAIANCKNYKEAVFCNALQIFIVHVLSSFWLANFRDFALFTLGASALGTACIGAFFGSVLFFPYAARPELSNGSDNITGRQFSPSFRILYFASVWTVWEWVKSNGFLGYPWGTLSMSVWNAKCLMQIADITGSYGITFLMALFSSVCAEGILLLPRMPQNQYPGKTAAGYKNCAVCCLCLFTLSFLYGAYQFGKKRVPSKYLNTVIVQQNLDPWADTSDSDSIEISLKLSEEKIDQMQGSHIMPDLVVWSEAVLRMPFPMAQNYYQAVPQNESLMAAISRLDVPFIIGAPYAFSKREYGNAAVLIDNNGNYRGSYSKMHLVPFAEVIPGIEFDWVAKTMDTLVGFSSGWKAGSQFALFDIPCHANPDYIPQTAIIPLAQPAPQKPSVKISTPICFEDAFPDVCRRLSQEGSELFVNLTDDSWSLTSSAEYQHFVIAALRSIEFRIPMLRSTNSGYSVIVDPAGRILADMPLFTAGALGYQIPVYEREITVYEKYGNLFVYGCMIFITAGILFKRRKDETVKENF